MTIPRNSRRGPGRPAEQANGDARAQLLAAATDLFSLQGAAATSFAAIARRAGLTPAMMHYYFKNREDLLECVVEAKIAPLLASVWDPVAAGIAPQELMCGIIERLVAGIERAPWIPSTWKREVLNEGGLLRSRVLRRLPLDKTQILSAALAQGQTRGEIDEGIDPVLVVFSMLGLVMMHLAIAPFFAEAFHRRQPGPREIGRHVTALLLNGLKPPNKGLCKKK